MKKTIAVLTIIGFLGLAAPRPAHAISATEGVLIGVGAAAAWVLFIGLSVHFIYGDNGSGQETLLLPGKVGARSDLPQKRHLRLGPECPVRDGSPSTLCW